MSGTGSNMVLDKGFIALSTYNSSNANGVVKNKLVKFATGGTVDLNVASNTRSIGVVQDSVEQVKVATGKAPVNVRMMGITAVTCTTAASVVLGSVVMSSTTGGVLLAATTGNIPIGIVVGITGTLADGDTVQVLLCPGLPALP